ncbi:MAG: hypothetical protein AAFV49_23425, partial [Pseudomonadota bacterium]
EAAPESAPGPDLNAALNAALGPSLGPSLDPSAGPAPGAEPEGEPGRDAGAAPGAATTAEPGAAAPAQPAAQSAAASPDRPTQPTTEAASAGAGLGLAVPDLGEALRRESGTAGRLAAASLAPTDPAGADDGLRGLGRTTAPAGLGAPAPLPGTLPPIPTAVPALPGPRIIRLAAPPSTLAPERMAILPPPKPGPRRTGEPAPIPPAKA